MITRLIIPIFLVVLHSNPSVADDSVSIISSGSDGLVLAYRPVCTHRDSIHANGKIYTCFHYDDHSLNAPQGTPSIQEKSVYFAVPGSVAPVIEISDVSWSECPNTILAPVPKVTEDNSGLFTETYHENTVSYRLSGYRPGSFFELTGSIECNGIPIWKLTLRPILFDAFASSVAVVDSFNVKIYFGTSQLKNQPGSIRLPDYIINRNMFSTVTNFQFLKKSSDVFADPFSSGEWYRVKIKEAGMYCITGAELISVGFPSGMVATDTIRMYYGGGKLLGETPHSFDENGFNEIAIKVVDDGDGYLNRNDKIIFYGSSISRFIPDAGNENMVYQNHLYAEENVYWLTVSDHSEPKHMQTSGETPSKMLSAQTTCNEFIHIEPENHPEFEESGLDWYWDKIDNSSKSYVFNTEDIFPGSSLKIRVAFLNKEKQKVGSMTLRPSHTVNMYVNQMGPYIFHFAADNILNAEIVPAGELNASKNILKIVRTDNDGCHIRLDWIELEYVRNLTCYQNMFDFFIQTENSPVKIAIGNVPNSQVEIFDTTDPYSVLEVINTAYAEKKLTFQVSPVVSNLLRFTVCNPENYLSVSSISKKEVLRPTLKSTENNVDYIIISHNTFVNEAKKLAEWRSRDSDIDPLAVRVIDVDAVYDEFSWGINDPVAIRDFLKYAWEYYRKPIRFCCLIGDTIWKYKNLTEDQQGRIFIPTMYFYDNECIATDDFFTWFDITHIPYLAIGRLCVSEEEDAQNLVRKIIDYEKLPEQGIWHNRILFIADDELGDGGIGSETEFTRDTEILENNMYIPDFLQRTKIMEVEYPLKNGLKPEATEMLLKEMDKGYLLQNYIGHGNTELISHEHILDGSRDIESINNGARQSVFFIASCSVGHFDGINNVSLAEMLNLRKEGGCIAVIAASRNTQNYPNVILNKSFYLNLFDDENNPEYRIGYALKEAKKGNSSDSNSNRYILMGDPATRLMVPRNSFSIAPVDTLYKLQKVSLTGNITHSGQSTEYTGNLYIVAKGPRIEKTYIANNGSKVSYTLPGKTFFNGMNTISGNEFLTEFIIPRDLSTEGDDPVINFFAAGGNTEASGIFKGFCLSDIYGDSTSDITGPDISLSFDGTLFQDGDTIRRQPVLNATISDLSGINIIGNRGHNITLTTDNTEIASLTDLFVSINGYISGTIEYELPILTSGEHTFELKAYDSYNNISVKSFTADVAGSLTGEIYIKNLLNYPNPMDMKGTTFTFSLTDDAGDAKIHIFSQSGRLVDTFSFSANLGYNTVFWKPSAAIANGIYFYKLTVRSYNGRKSSKTEKLVMMR